MAGNGNDRVDTSDREILQSRMFDAPRALVFEAFTRPEHIACWWGPNGFRTTTKSMDVRPGGTWRFTMHGPDGKDWPNHIAYREVVVPERLVYDHGADEGPPLFHVTVTFDERGGGTYVTMKSVFPTAEACEAVKKFGAIEGGRQTLGRAAAYVAGGLSKQFVPDAPAAVTGEAFVISREFDAPRDLMWKVWTEREHLMQWFGPKGVTMPVCTLDFRPGGFMHYCMRMDNGYEMWGKWVFREIAPPERLVFTSSFADPEGNIARAPFAETWPLRMLSVVTFGEREGRTTVSVSWTAYEASAEEQRTFDEGRESMRGGWTGTLDMLEAHLRKVRGG